MRKEATTRFTPIVNRYFDKVGIRAFPLRKFVYSKLRTRLLDLFTKSCNIKSVNADPTRVQVMYRGFAKDPNLFQKLKALQIKNNRSSLFPSDEDMQILADADKLGETSDVRFITGDHHFLDFQPEIESRLNVKIVELLSLGSYTI